MSAFDHLMPPEQDGPVINGMIEDALAHAPDEASRAMILASWLQLGTEYLAREVGRGRTRDTLRGLDAFVRDARPSKPWKD